MVRARLKTDRILIAWLVFTVIFDHVQPLLHVGGLAGYSYMLLTLFWMWSLRKEITELHIRSCLLAGGLLIILLFVFRVIRYNYVTPLTFPHRLMWYLYYIPILVIPLLSLSVSLRIGNNHKEKRKKKLIPFLSILCALMIAFVLTNDIHSMAFRIWYENGEEHSTAMPLYFLIILWYIGMTLFSLFLLIYQCRISFARKYLFIPAFVEGFALLLWFIYYIPFQGSSPKAFGVNLYNIQEVYLLLFLGLWESSILIGIIPSLSLAQEREWIREGILKSVEEELSEVRSIFGRMWKQEEEAFRKELIRLCCLGAYIKRRANLELISDENGCINAAELSLAIRETMEYYSLCNLSSGYEESGSAPVLSRLIIAAYDIFRHILDSAHSACYVRLQSDVDDRKISFTMKTESDMENLLSPTGDFQDPEAIFVNSADREILDLFGAVFKTDVRDDTVFFTISAACPLQGSFVKTLRLKSGLRHQLPADLSEMAGYLSLEEKVLASKIRIHDGIGRCLIISKRYLLDAGSVEKEALFREWDRALSEIDSISPGIPEDLPADTAFKQAEFMGIKVELTGALPEQESLREVVDSAITVHITNVAKHTTGKKAFIRSMESSDAYVLSFRNDGESRQSAVEETGGLLNLRRQTEALGGSMSVETDPDFRLVLNLPKE